MTAHRVRIAEETRYEVWEDGDTCHETFDTFDEALEYVRAYECEADDYGDIEIREVEYDEEYDEFDEYADFLYDNSMDR